MKTYLKLSFAYALLGMAGGVFFREFTKLNGFTQQTTLGVVHTHAFVLGMLFFLVVLVLDHSFSLSKHKHHTAFIWLYNVGLIITMAMLLIRGVVQVLQPNLSTAANAAISGIAGLGHICLGIGLLLFFNILKSSIEKSK